MNEYRCKFCKKLLFKYNPVVFENETLVSQSVGLEIMNILCPKCKTVNTLNYGYDSKAWRMIVGSAK